MDWASLLYLGVTFTLFVVFVLIVRHTYNKKRKNQVEAPKHRMLDDDEPLN